MLLGCDFRGCRPIKAKGGKRVSDLTIALKRDMNAVFIDRVMLFDHPALGKLT